MTVLRPATFISGIFGKVGQMGYDRAVGVIIKKSVPWAKAPITISNTPYTIIYPHPRQAEARYKAFPAFVRSATGRRWETLKGKSYKANLTKPAVGKVAKRTYRTEAEGLKLLEKLK
jgi:hypothetical protein